MKTILTALILSTTFLCVGQSSDLIYVPSQKSLVASYQNHNRIGFYIGGYIRTTFPYPYIYTTPVSFINRVGVNFGSGKYNFMVGGYVENFRDSLKVKPDLWFKVYPLRIITKTDDGFDLIFAVNYMNEFRYGVGITIPFGGIYYRL